MTGTKERFKEKIIPISWTAWDQLDTCLFQFYEVEFEQDFGPYKEGDEIENLTIDFENGILETYQYNEVFKSHNFKIILEEEF